MQCISVFLDTAKFADFRWKNADVSRTPGECHVVHISFGFSLDKVNSAKFHHCRICVTDLRKGEPFCSPPSGAAPKMPILNRVKKFTKFTGKHLCQSFFFNKVVGLRPATLLKKDSGIGVFRWIFQNF